MSQAKSLTVRHEVIRLKKTGLTHAQISETLQIGLGTVKNLWKRYLISGESGLLTAYSNCGRRVESSGERTYRLIRLTKYLHPSWGVPFIILKIGEKYPQLDFRSIRQYQRRLFEGSGKLPPPILPPRIILDKARVAHDAWQIDAKERFPLLDGKEVCYLTIADESTGAILAARAFPPGSDCAGSIELDTRFSDTAIPNMGDA